MLFETPGQLALLRLRLARQRYAKAQVVVFRGPSTPKALARRKKERRAADYALTRAVEEMLRLP